MPWKVLELSTAQAQVPLADRQGIADGRDQGPLGGCLPRVSAAGADAQPGHAGTRGHVPASPTAAPEPVALVTPVCFCCSAVPAPGAAPFPAWPCLFPDLGASWAASSPTLASLKPGAAGQGLARCGARGRISEGRRLPSALPPHPEDPWAVPSRRRSGLASSYLSPVPLCQLRGHRVEEGLA